MKTYRTLPISSGTECVCSNSAGIVCIAPSSTAILLFCRLVLYPFVGGICCNSPLITAASFAFEVRACLRSKNAHANDTNAIAPSGIPTPIPIATSWFVPLLPVLVDVVEFGRRDGDAGEDGTEPET